VVQNHAELYDDVNRRIDFIIGFGTLTSNNLEDFEYTQTVKCPCCNSILQVRIN